MSTQPTNAALPIQAAPDPTGSELAPLLAEPFARVWEPSAAQVASARAVRGRLLGRLAASRAAESVMFTARRQRLPSQALGQGVLAQTPVREGTSCA